MEVGFHESIVQRGVKRLSVLRRFRFVFPAPADLHFLEFAEFFRLFEPSSSRRETAADLRNNFLRRKAVVSPKLDRERFVFGSVGAPGVIFALENRLLDLPRFLSLYEPLADGRLGTIYFFRNLLKAQTLFSSIQPRGFCASRCSGGFLPRSGTSRP